MAPTTQSLIDQACKELGLNQQGVASVIGVSVRTIQRRRTNSGVQYPWEYHKLVRAVHPRNPDLAAQLAACAGTNLEALGLVVPKTASPAAQLPPAPPAAQREHAEAVVSAAADAMNVAPRDARPVVAAIFSRVSELDVDLPGLVKMLKADRGAAVKPPLKK